MKKGKPVSLALALVLFVSVINLMFLKVDTLQQLDEYVYFSFQMMRSNDKSRIQLFNTSESHCDSLIDYISTIKDPNKIFLINLPKASEKELPRNVFMIYDLYDDLNYTSFNVKFTSVNQLQKLTSFLRSTSIVYDDPYINYVGDHNSFDQHYLISFNSLRAIRSGIIIIGYAGEHFDPRLQNDRIDSVEMWFTPKFEMYDLVLKGNIVENILRNEFVYKLGGLNSFISCLFIVVAMYGYLFFFNANNYMIFKLFQLVLVFIIILATILSFKIGVFLPFTVLLIVIILVGEMVFWIKRITQK